MDDRFLATENPPRIKKKNQTRELNRGRKKKCTDANDCFWVIYKVAPPVAEPNQQVWHTVSGSDDAFAGKRDEEPGAEPW